MPPFIQSSRCLSPSRETCFPCTVSTFKPRVDSHHGATWESPEGKPRGKASWEILVGKPRGKASRESHRSLYPREGKRDTAATAREERARACPHSRRGLTPLRKLQNTPRSMSALERNPERLPSNSHGDWPFLRPPELVSEVPDLSREHLPQLEKIQEVLPSRRDEAHFR